MSNMLENLEENATPRAWNFLWINVDEPCKHSPYGKTNSLNKSLQILLNEAIGFLLGLLL